MSKLIAPNQFINVLVKVIPGKNPGEYLVHTAPEIPYVTQPDTILNYQIYDCGDKNIVFTGMSVTPVDNKQLSQASVSVSGKTLTFSDANTNPAKMILNITLQFKDEDGIQFSHDPEVVNEVQR